MSEIRLIVETTGFRTHFWDEKYYKDSEGRIRWQMENLIVRKLWALTEWDNLDFANWWFPHYIITYRMKEWWIGKKNLRPILKQLLTERERAEAIVSLAEEFDDPGEPYIPSCQLGEVVPRQCWVLKVKIRINKRTVHWEKSVEVTALVGKQSTLWPGKSVTGNFVKAATVNQIFGELE